MAGVLVALGFPLAASQAAAQQHRVVVDRIDDTTRFAALAQFVNARNGQIATNVDDAEQLHTRILHGWLLLAAGELAAMAIAVLFAVRLTAWVLRPVARLDRVTHDIATGRMTSRVEEAGGPPELRRLIRSFNEMADNVEAV